MGLRPYQKFQLEFFQEWELAQNQLDTIGFRWIQIRNRLDFSPTRQNWFQVGHLMGNILRGEIYNWKKQNPTHSNSLKSNQMSSTEFPIGLS